MIETERLRCEPVTASHASAMFEVLADERIYRYLPSDPPESVEALRERYEFLSSGRSPDGREAWLNWILVKRTDGTPIGYFQATVREPQSCEIAYVLGPASWGRGYAREASVALISHLFDAFKISSVCANIDTRNGPSLKLVEALGLVRTRTILEADEFKGAKSDEHVLEVPREAWRAGTPRA
jgi:ribosomal-protein-alanine N-acetyltransferase